MNVAQRDVHYWHVRVSIAGLIGWWIIAVIASFRGRAELATLDYIAGVISYIAFGPKR